MLDLMRSFSCTLIASFVEEFLLHWLLILVLMGSFPMPYTPQASFSEVIVLHSSLLVLVRRFSSSYIPHACFSDEFPLHSAW